MITYRSLLFASILVGSASAAVVFSEDFSYADGDLIGKNGGTGFTSAWTSSQATSGNIDVSSSAAHSNPNGTLQSAQVNRTFTGFTETKFIFKVDYDIIANTEGGYDFQVVLRDTNNKEIFSIGNRNNQGSSGEYYVARLGSGGGAQTQIKLGGSETFTTPDTLTVEGTISGTMITADITSTYFPAMNVTGLSRDTGGSAIDFSTGGTLRIQKSNLDNMQIAVDNIQLEAIPEPTTSVLSALGLLGFLIRRKR